MKNWFIPAALLGLSGLGLLISSERARQQILGLFEEMSEQVDPMGEFSHFCETQLEAIQNALDHLAQALEEEQA